MGLAVGQSRGGISQRVFEQGQRARALEMELAHVAQIENACRTAHGKMLLDDAAIAERRLEAAELCRACAEFAMQGCQRGALDRFHQPV